MNIWRWFNQAGPITRTHKVQAEYRRRLDSSSDGECAFCLITSKQPEGVVEAGELMLVIRNEYGYAVWDGCGVKEHLMVIPREHRATLAGFNEAELKEWQDLLSKYESLGYSLYTRSPDNPTKSVAHHHTHFIKLNKKRRSWLLYVRQPHIMVSR